MTEPRDAPVVLRNEQPAQHRQEPKAEVRGKPMREDQRERRIAFGFFCDPMDRLPIEPRQRPALDTHDRVAFVAMKDDTTRMSSVSACECGASGSAGLGVLKT